MSDWPRTEYLSRILPEGPLTALVANDNLRFMDNDIMARKVQLAKEDLLSRVFGPRTAAEGTERLYYRDLLTEAMLADFPAGRIAAQFGGDVKHDLMRVWIGTEGNVTPLHYDRCHGLLAQVAYFALGSIRLLPPFFFLVLLCV